VHLKTLIPCSNRGLTRSGMHRMSDSTQILASYTRLISPVEPTSRKELSPLRSLSPRLEAFLRRPRTPIGATGRKWPPPTVLRIWITRTQLAARTITSLLDRISKPFQIRATLHCVSLLLSSLTAKRSVTTCPSPTFLREASSSRACSRSPTARTLNLYSPAMPSPLLSFLNRGRLRASIQSLSQVVSPRKSLRTSA
jgi:hypothetical protein